ncbi:hypothetical protein GCM10023216_01030 [Isoptericola chiayiensis]|uniref:Uncharacterized protein n=1 Tax=Isoptericola chiayiensis TaxID=579446 RepID=A0ABP8XYH6_9MICO|nr:hypothetical protein [Isoptericola chiayiensis]NOW01335.1 hypothetical protein [Isoptericola chiayiensis]
MRALARDRRERRRNRALTSHLQAVIKDADERIRHVEAGSAAIARENADLAEIAAGHEAAARDLAKMLWHVASNYGDRIVNQERVRTYLMHYLPELRSPDYVEPEPAPDPYGNPWGEG